MQVMPVFDISHSELFAHNSQIIDFLLKVNNF